MKWLLRFFLALYLFLFGGYHSQLVKACHRCTYQNQKSFPETVSLDLNKKISQSALNFSASSSATKRFEKLKATEEDEEDDEVSVGNKKSLDKTGTCFAGVLYPPLSHFYNLHNNAVNQGVHTTYAVLHRFIILRVIRI